MERKRIYMVEAVKRDGQVYAKRSFVGDTVYWNRHVAARQVKFLSDIGIPCRVATFKEVDCCNG